MNHFARSSAVQFVWLPWRSRRTLETAVRTQPKSWQAYLYEVSIPRLISPSHGWDLARCRSSCLYIILQIVFDFGRCLSGCPQIIAHIIWAFVRCLSSSLISIAQTSWGFETLSSADFDIVVLSPTKQKREAWASVMRGTWHTWEVRLGRDSWPQLQPPGTPSTPLWGRMVPSALAERKYLDILTLWFGRSNLILLANPCLPSVLS